MQGKKVERKCTTDCCLQSVVTSDECQVLQCGYTFIAWKMDLDRGDIGRGGGGSSRVGSCHARRGGPFSLPTTTAGSMAVESSNVTSGICQPKVSVQDAFFYQRWQAKASKSSQAAAARCIHSSFPASFLTYEEK